MNQDAWVQILRSESGFEADSCSMFMGQMARALTDFPLAQKVED